MARPRNGVRCPECGALLLVLKTRPAGPDDRDVTYTCPECGGVGDRREQVQGEWIRWVPPLVLRVGRK